ncbi:MAG: HEAT repeat domain-containing protein, partial [Nitrospinota bacterium]
MPALRDPEPEVREAAAQALGSFEDREATQALVTALREAADPEDRGHAARALSHASGPDVVDALIAALGDDDPLVRREAAVALAHTGDPRAVEPLCEALSDPEVIGVAAHALGEIGDAKATPSLLDRFRSEPKAGKLLTARALGKLGDDRSSDALLEAVLREPDHDVRREAAHALGRTSGDPAVETLLKTLQDST